MKVLFFAQLKNAVGQQEVYLDADDLNTASLWDLLIRTYPALATYRPAVRLARNSEYVGADARFHNTDEVALIPPVSGG